MYFIIIIKQCCSFCPFLNNMVLIQCTDIAFINMQFLAPLTQNCLQLLYHTCGLYECVLLISNHYGFDRMLNESSLTKKCVWKARHLFKQIQLAELYVKPKHINTRGSSSVIIWEHLKESV